MKPVRILETALYVDDLSEAEEFYSKVIGLKLQGKDQARHLFFYCGEGMLLLFLADKTKFQIGPVPPHGSVGAGHVAFEVGEGDFDDWRRRLIEHEVEIETEIDWPEGSHSIYLRDPSGNSLELTTPRTWGIDRN